MPANLRKIMDGIPRPLELMARETKENPNPLHTKPIGPKEQMARLEPIMGLLANGHIPLDEQAARAVASYVNGFHRKIR